MPSLHKAAKIEARIKLLDALVERGLDAEAAKMVAETLAPAAVYSLERKLRNTTTPVQ